MKHSMIAIITLAISPNVLADGFYLGAGIGTTDFDDGGAYKNEISTAVTSEPDGATYKLIAGYTFNRVLSLEAQYTDYGDIKNTLPLLNSSSQLKHTSAILLSNIGYTFDNGIRPFGTIGLGSIESKDGTWSDSGTAYRAGLGLDFTPKSFNELSFRLAYEVDMYTVEINQLSGYRKKEYDMTMSSLYFSTLYNF